MNGSDERGSIYRVDVSDAGNSDARFLAAKWIQPGSKVLDVGCACGDLGIFLRQRLECEVYGLEYNEASIKIAKETGAYTEIHQVDLNAFDSGDFDLTGRFDAIVICDVLEHLLDPVATLLKIKPYLKADGRLLLSLPNVTHASIKILLLSNKIRYTKTGLLDETHLHFYTWRSIFDLVGKTSFEVEDIEMVTCGMNGAYPGDVIGYVTDNSIVKKILSDDESYIFQYVLKARNGGGTTSFKDFSSRFKQCLSSHASVIDSLRKRDLNVVSRSNMLGLRFRYVRLRGRILVKIAMNKLRPSQKLSTKIDRLEEKARYLRQAFQS